MKAPNDWSVKELYLHLQHAVDLELWTIPLYLSAVYSVRDLDQIDNAAQYPDAAKLVLSVAIQEMLHLELVCNLCRAMGYSPTFAPPNYHQSDAIPFIHPNPDDLPDAIRGYRVGVRPLEKDQLKLFCAIEFPHQIRNLPWSQRQRYESIGELYEALEIGVATLWERCFVPDRQVAPQFAGYTRKRNLDIGFSQTITNKETALQAIHAIVAQGEGVSHDEVPREFEPPPQKSGDFDPGWFDPSHSHYQKFFTILDKRALPEVYSLNGGSETGGNAQRALTNNFSALLEALAASFGDSGNVMASNFYDLMFRLSGSITAVWRSGGIPDFSLERH